MCCAPDLPCSSMLVYVANCLWAVLVFALDFIPIPFRHNFPGCCGLSCALCRCSGLIFGAAKGPEHLAGDAAQFMQALQHMQEGPSEAGADDDEDDDE